MKKSLLGLMLLAASGAAVANDGFYIGAAYSQLSYGTVVFSEQTDSDNGFAANLGYDFAFGRVFTLGAEVEYKDLGGVVEKGSMGNSTVEADLSASSIGVNVLPKFYIGDRFYLLGKLGMHSVDYSMKVTAMGKTTPVDKSATEVSFGGGLGYHFGNFTAQTTYEAMTVDTTSLGAINIGMQYHF